MESEHGSLCTTALFEQSATEAGMFGHVSWSKSVISIKTPRVLGFPRLFQGFARW